MSWSPMGIKIPFFRNVKKCLAIRPRILILKMVFLCVPSATTKSHICLTKQTRRCIMAHDKKKQSTGSWKGNRDKHQKTDRNNSVTDSKKNSGSKPFNLGKNTGRNNPK
jgi:hypothetical protein